MIPLAVVVRDVLADQEAQVALAKRDDAVETLLFDRPNEPFGIRVEIGTLRRQSDGMDSTAGQAHNFCRFNTLLPDTVPPPPHGRDGPCAVHR